MSRGVSLRVFVGKASSAKYARPYALPDARGAYSRIQRPTLHFSSELLFILMSSQPCVHSLSVPTLRARRVASPSLFQRADGQADAMLCERLHALDGLQGVAVNMHWGE